ncbi:endo-1,3-alpha-glucanase family glycosylhydrolase [Yinghuangia seranimata]|uniref:endo-1,3-alpha-glucanase family glycosylhydrolase n=1 Tax=Yinghuangia seranimata TaxID=408067 RepID=UPI00248ADF75|nr:endo-1,3-alpha-glucanase family glycosylhydrolase [Yinghuangia seranimata]MDI2127498.1 endo-1,3-alpha-glucanase family glycosylhydrolase [Yinghuangia seranimata]
MRTAAAALTLTALLAAVTGCDPDKPPPAGGTAKPSTSAPSGPTTTKPGGGSATGTPGTPTGPGTPTTPGTPTATATAPGTPEGATAGLPFALPSTAALRSSPHKVFAHYFTPYPVSLDNAAPADDYYARNYLNPAGEGGRHQAYGGLLRDRPLPRAPLSGDWELQDMESEVRTAVSAGIDGFTVDLLDLTPGSQHRKRVDALVKAAERVDPGFRVILMPDMTAGKIKGLDAAGLAAALAPLAGSPAMQRLDDGRLVVSPFKAEERPAAWWADFAAAMERQGRKTALVPVFLNLNANAQAFAQVSYGFSVWGNRSPNAQGGIGGDAAKAHGMGKIWMQPVSVQDERPNQAIFDEAGNTENLRATWEGAIGKGADWVQLTTWNDYSEGTQFAPSVHNGRVYLDISTYYATWFKTGGRPVITRDTVYVTHRLQFAGTRPAAAGQQQFMAPRPGTLAPRDTVEALAFLTGPATVRVQSGGQAKDNQAPAGVSAYLVPLAYGAQSAAVTRGGTSVAAVTTTFEVRADPRTQDLQYVAAGSARR